MFRLSCRMYRSLSVWIIMGDFLMHCSRVSY
jgi:hypothetical protein